MVIEAYHMSRSGQLKDLIDENTGEVIFPFSKGLILHLSVPNEEYLPERDVELEENNTESNKYVSFLKLNKWTVLGCVLPEHTIDLLYMLKVVSNKYIIRNNKREQIYDIIVTEDDKSDGVVSVTIQLLLKEYSITGNY